MSDVLVRPHLCGARLPDGGSCGHVVADPHVRHCWQHDRPLLAERGSHLRPVLPVAPTVADDEDEAPSPLEAATASLRQFARFGAAFGPPAHHYILVGIDGEGVPQGELVVCGACLRRVAADAVAVFDGLRSEIPPLLADLGDGEGYEVLACAESFETAYGGRGACDRCGEEID